MKRNIAIVIGLIIVVIAIGGALYAQSMPTTRQITVQAFDFFFTIPGTQGQNPTITVRSGDTVILTVQNMGSKNDHEFFVVTQSDYNAYVGAIGSGQSADEPEPAFPNGSVEDVVAGQSKTGTFVVGAPGTYVYACFDKDGTEPLTHSNRGMFGTFQVNSGGLFSLTRSLGGTLENVFTLGLSSLPSIAIWQVAVVVTLIAATKRNA